MVLSLKNPSPRPGKGGRSVPPAHPPPRCPAQVRPGAALPAPWGRAAPPGHTIFPKAQTNDLPYPLRNLPMAFPFAGGRERGPPAAFKGRNLASGVLMCGSPPSPLFPFKIQSTPGNGRTTQPA